MEGLITLLYIYIYIKSGDIVISLSCDIYNNVFRLTRVVLLGQITQRSRILLIKYLSPVNIFNYYEIFYDILKLLMNYINRNLNVSINLTN
jgi:hypothetical protein